MDWCTTFRSYFCGVASLLIDEKEHIFRILLISTSLPRCLIYFLVAQKNTWKRIKLRITTPFYISFSTYWLYAKIREKKTVFHEKIHSFTQRVNQAFWELNILSYCKGSPVIRRTCDTLSSRTCHTLVWQVGKLLITDSRVFGSGGRVWERGGNTYVEMGVRGRKHMHVYNNTKEGPHRSMEGPIRPWRVTAVVRISLLFELPRKFSLEKKALRKK